MSMATASADGYSRIKWAPIVGHVKPEDISYFTVI
jgi:hypothetical protein